MNSKSSGRLGGHLVVPVASLRLGVLHLRPIGSNKLRNFAVQVVLVVPVPRRPPAGPEAQLLRHLLEQSSFCGRSRIMGHMHTSMLETGQPSVDCTHRTCSADDIMSTLSPLLIGVQHSALAAELAS